MDEFLDFASGFDWITPTWAYLKDFLNGPPADFGISAHAGWGSRDIKYLLKQAGIDVWGLMLSRDGNMLMFTVNKSQARWADYTLSQAGVPVMYRPKEAG